MAASISQTTSLAAAALDFLRLHSQGQLFFNEPSAAVNQGGSTTSNLTPPIVRPSSSSGTATGSAASLATATATAAVTQAGSETVSPSSATNPAASIFSSLLHKPSPSGPLPTLAPSSADVARPSASTAATAQAVMQSLAAAATASSRVASLDAIIQASFYRDRHGDSKAPGDDCSIKEGQTMGYRRQGNSHSQRMSLLVADADGAGTGSFLTGSRKKRSAEAVVSGAAAAAAAAAAPAAAAVATAVEESERDPSDGYPCRVCSTWFPTGQALGGHMRKHVKDEQARRVSTGTGVSHGAAMGSSPASKTAGSGDVAGATASGATSGGGGGNLGGGRTPAGTGAGSPAARRATQAAYHASSSAGKHDATNAAAAVASNTHNLKAGILHQLDRNPAAAGAVAAGGGGGGNHSFQVGHPATGTPSAGSMRSRGVRSPRGTAGGTAGLSPLNLSRPEVLQSPRGTAGAGRTAAPDLRHLLPAVLPAANPGLGGGVVQVGDGIHPSSRHAAKRIRVSPSFPRTGNTALTGNGSELPLEERHSSIHAAGAAAALAAVTAQQAAAAAAASKLLPSSLPGSSNISLLSPQLQNYPGSGDNWNSRGQMHAPPPAIPAWLQRLLAPTGSASVPECFNSSSSLLPHTLTTLPVASASHSQAPPGIVQGRNSPHFPPQPHSAAVALVTAGMADASAAAATAAAAGPQAASHVGNGDSTMLEFLLPRPPSASSSAPLAGYLSTPDPTLARSESSTRLRQLLTGEHTAQRNAAHVDGGRTEGNGGSAEGMLQVWPGIGGLGSLAADGGGGGSCGANGGINGNGNGGSGNGGSGSTHSYACLRLSGELPLLDGGISRNYDDMWNGGRLGDNKGIGAMDLELRL